MRKLLFAICFAVMVSIIAVKIFDYKPTTTQTLLVVKNSSNDTIKVWLTLDNDTNFVTDVNGIFGISDTGLQGYFILYPDSFVNYTGTISGNICFGSQPINCPDSVYKTGVNLFEFTLNNTYNSNNQEAIDISCVSGVNSIGTFITTGGGSWIAYDTTIQTFSNSTIFNNTNRYGVYPYMCDVCIASDNPPICNDTTIIKPNINPICNVQRPISERGGVVAIDFINFVNE